MRIGRMKSGGFVVSNDSSSWSRIEDLGCDAVNTQQLVLQAVALEQALQASGGSGSIKLDNSDLGCPVVRPSKMLAVGMNYRDHAEELGQEIPSQPVIFAKYVSSLNGPFDPVILDRRVVQQADYEAELAVIVGQCGRWLSVEEARQSIFGFAVANDVSARDYLTVDSQYSRSKSMDTFCPVGPWITTQDSVDLAGGLSVTCSVNGTVRQSSNTQKMIFDAATLVSYLSRTMTLEPGDVILTGTPAGVGVGEDPPIFLNDGDEVKCEISGLGYIQNQFVQYDGLQAADGPVH